MTEVPPSYLIANCQVGLGYVPAENVDSQRPVIAASLPSFPIPGFLMRISADWTHEVPLYLKVYAEQFAQLEQMKSSERRGVASICSGTWWRSRPSSVCPTGKDDLTLFHPLCRKQ